MKAMTAMEYAEMRLKRRLEGKGQVNPDLLDWRMGRPDYGRMDTYPIQARIWWAVAERFTSNCNGIMIEDGNLEFFKREFGAENAEQIMDEFGFLYEVEPGRCIEVLSGPDESEVIPISQVEMMEFNERYRESSSPLQRREMLLELMEKYGL